MKPLAVRVPGKLMLAGEYAILSPGAQALILAVDRYLRVDMRPEQTFSLVSDLVPEPWQFDPARIDFLLAPVPLRFAAAALALGRQALGADFEALGPFSLRISSQLHEAELKLGLGSSAAVTVGVLAALLAATGQNPGDAGVRLRLFKLALLAHRAVQGSGSGADLAGCIFGSVTAYTSGDYARLPLTAPLDKLLSMDWPLLGLQRLDWPWSPPSFGWTGLPASSADLIADFEDWQRAEPEAHGEFLFESSLVCLGLRESLLQADSGQLTAGLGRARRLLLRLQSEMAGNLVDPPVLETPALQALAEAAEALGGAGKLSGAGGGDCGLAWVEPNQAGPLQQAWLAAGVRPLRLGLDSQGVGLTP